MIGAIDEGTRLGGGRYTLERRLGKGGAATVWLGEDSVLERPVAVKVLSEALASDENWLARFSREARIAARLSHPNLVSVYDFGTGDERPYIVMAHMPGGSLWDRMQLGEPSDPDRLARDLLTALEAIHAAGIIHRDVKPGNVLFDAAGTACLTDFGVARPEDATSLTQTGQIPGTGKFMAPELWAGERADERSDLYGCGVVLREATGSDAPPELQALIERLVAENPADRPASASAALDELSGFVPATQVALPPDPPPERTVVPGSGGRSHRGVAIAGLALLAVVAAFAIAQAVGGGEDPPQNAGQGGEEVATAKPDGDNSGSGGSGGSGSSGPSDASGSGSGGAAEAQPTSQPTAATPVSGDGAALNDQGYALLQAGDVEGALPILEQAVNAFPQNSTDINYAYALYNYADALMQAGRPDEAIPYLEKRLTFDDQTETVQATLDEARAAAGED